MTPGVLRQHISLDFLSLHDTGGAPTAHFVRLLVITPVGFGGHVSLDLSSVHDTGGAPTAYFVTLLISS